MYSIEKLKKDLLILGVKEGDVLLVRAGLRSIGQIDTKKKEDYLKFLLDAVGENGTIVGLSFTQSFFLMKNKNIVFDGKNKSYTGAFANIMLKHPKAVRSSHPMNSYVSIGKDAEYILREHDQNSGAYDPIRKIIDLKGKMILIGCAGTSPGFTTTHLAEIDLGLNKRIVFPTLDQVFYKQGDDVKLFKRKDAGSCSSTFYKFYSYYIKNEILKQGYIGNAYSILIDAYEAYKIDYDVLKKNPKITICDNPSCLLCRARRWDNLKDLPFFIVREVIPRVFKKLVKKFNKR